MKEFLDDLYLKYLNEDKSIIPFEKNYALYQDLQKDLKAELSEEQKDILDQLLSILFKETYERKKDIFFDGFEKGFLKALEFTNFFKK